MKLDRLHLGHAYQSHPVGTGGSAGRLATGDRQSRTSFFAFPISSFQACLPKVLPLWF